MPEESWNDYCRRTGCDIEDDYEPGFYDPDAAFDSRRDDEICNEED